MVRVILYFFLIYIPNSISKPYAIENFERNQEWIPIPKEMVFNVFEEFYNYKLNERQNDRMWNPSKVHENEHVLKNNAIVTVNPYRVNGDKLTIDDVSIRPPEKEKIQETKENSIVPRKGDKQDLSNCTKNYNQSHTKINSNFDSLNEAKKYVVERSLRQSKKISERNLVKEINNLIVQSEQIASQDDINEEELLSVKIEKDNLKENKDTYEVSEDVNATESFETDQSTVKENYGYVYNPPLLNSFQYQNNLTNNFQYILSKYNIKTDDELPNYALSVQRNKTPVKPALLNFGVQLRMPQSYNSLNHLSVDPVFAVLLSNYGYYLPGLYGIQSNYRNLYGYLASNNIHNNRPFGFYKVFSDTDSSN